METQPQKFKLLHTSHYDYETADVKALAKTVVPWFSNFSSTGILVLN